MKKKYKYLRILALLLAALMAVIAASCSLDEDYFSDYGDGDTAAETVLSSVVNETATAEGPETLQASAIDENGWYDSKDEVALYIETYRKLPQNYIKKSDAQALGWTGGSLEPYAPGKSIGGDHFGNYEGLLPQADGRSYTECDIDTAGKSSRGAKRIVFSNDGLIYYTDDHYSSFTLIYGDAG